MWEPRGAPADAERLAEAERKLGRRLPEQLRRFLLEGDGAEGWFSDFYVAVWPVDRLLDENLRGDLAARFPNVLLFGSDGSREYLGLDLRVEPSPVVMVEFIAMSPDELVHQAASFDEFLEQLPTIGLRESS
jgi:SMI1 / KNR4 family (SUKH-1)